MKQPIGNHWAGTVGICIGASTLTVVRLGLKAARSPSAPLWTHTRVAHEGDPRSALLRSLRTMQVRSGEPVAVTGRRFRHFLNLSTLTEPEAVERAYRHVREQLGLCHAIVSAGGETFMAYYLNAEGHIADVVTGNKCASGTGEFFLQQCRRMGISMAEAAGCEAVSSPYEVSGRCAVFCKSDCTHATNKGISKRRVAAGLGRMMANKIVALLEKSPGPRILLTGGVAGNRMVVNHLKAQFPELIVPAPADCFEALGAAFWAQKNHCKPLPAESNLFLPRASVFSRLPPLCDHHEQVSFKKAPHGRARAGDEAILGLDVGSTTTKAVLLRMSDRAMLASVYLRTEGDPVGASRRCYAALHQQLAADLDPESVTLRGLGVCGSGRQIAGLHAQTQAVINEIVAHATAAAHFDPEVDTIFEIGGQDAKYTFLTNGVPSDYTMNEACSAGTGSFLEESALEALAIETDKVADFALQAGSAPNFTDQCAAFIASDVKNAIHEGIGSPEIAAGLVYSVCMNYNHRVRGNRPVGQKIFMQGGVCYNRAVPLAMAALTGRHIVVPPHPGLMGAFGVALEVQKRLNDGRLQPACYDLKRLSSRDMHNERPFVCRGGRRGCDRRCTIFRIRIENKTYPFGGACNRYVNLRHKIHHDTAALDRVHLRQQIIFGPSAGQPPRFSESSPPRARIGINRSFMVHRFFPFFDHFFGSLGFETVLPEAPTAKGCQKRNSAFCYPAELAHGFFDRLLGLESPPDYLFLPHLVGVPSRSAGQRAQVCPFVQAEPYYLRMAFAQDLQAHPAKLLQPVLNMEKGLSAAYPPLIEMARRMGVGRKKAKEALKKAAAHYRQTQDQLQQMGVQALEALACNPRHFCVVLFGRPYNAFALEAHMGIPHKLASRGVMVLPLDMLPLSAEKAKRHMYWGSGQWITQAAGYVARHPQLFATYITNFSCGPDSFLLGYFRQIMGAKPSLTLELDSHTADAGLETRIEAFLDIVAAHRRLHSKKAFAAVPVKVFQPARTAMAAKIPVVLANGRSLPLTDPKVTLLLPSMGRLSSEAIAGVFKSAGFHPKVQPPADEAVLKLGRAHTSCKECLPLILTTGALMSYLNNGRKPDEMVVYFMPTGSGPCRFGQYAVYMEDLVRRLEIPDVAFFSLSSENSYAGVSDNFRLQCWEAFVIADVFEDIRAMLLANACDGQTALALFEDQWRDVGRAIARGRRGELDRQLEKSARALACLSLKEPISAVPKITLAGEIFVRRDGLSRQFITEYLAERGFAAICAPISEWIHYTDYLVRHGLTQHRLKLHQRVGQRLRSGIMRSREKRIKQLLSASRCVVAAPIDIHKIISAGRPYLSERLTGEAILTIGSALSEVATHTCGAIAIGPFGCMPNRLSEAILTEAMQMPTQSDAHGARRPWKSILNKNERRPFLAIESDGGPFPQQVVAKLETFCLRARRMHQRMQSVAGKH